jgi:hypothetical protein
MCGASHKPHARRFFKPQPERTTSGLMHPNALRSGMVQDTRHSAMALHGVCKSTHNLPPFQECDGPRSLRKFPARFARSSAEILSS